MEVTHLCGYTLSIYYFTQLQISRRIKKEEIIRQKRKNAVNWCEKN